MKNYYEILEVNKKASIEVIERAYKVLVRKYHPDVNKNEIHINVESKIRDLNEAYDVLSNEMLRDQYDRELEEYEFENMMKKSTRFLNMEGEQSQKSKQKEKKNNKEKNKTEKANDDDYQVGTIGGLFNVVKNIFAVRKSIGTVEKFNKTTALAIAITIIIVVLLCVIMWFIPFTNNFVRTLTVDNQLLSWMF